MPFPEHLISSEERDLSQIALAAHPLNLPLIEKFSKYNRLRRNIHVALIFRFITNCRVKEDDRGKYPILTVQEIERTEEFWCCTAQQSEFLDGFISLKTKGN